MGTHIRVRFAPSPTGTLHLGSARSALYNWLFARHAGADAAYVLRIEDTDVERSTPEHVAQALAVFRWLGLDWDEGPEVGGPYGPYAQSERADDYRAALDRLRASGHAYDCFCTREQLDADRAEAEREQRPHVYAGRCRDLAATGADAERRAAGEPFVVRFRVPSGGATTVHDLVLGDATFEHEVIGDFVIARADGTPLYNFANVVDDMGMRITHVIRGNDHLSNTPRQILVYEALGATPPAFAHLPMVLGPDGAKLSKRRHHTSTVEQLAAEGYAPAAVRNALALVGWSKDDVTNVMTTEELVEHFDIARVKRSAAAIDYDKLRWINGEHLRAMDPSEWAAGYEQWRAEWIDDADERRDAAFAADGALAASLVQQKVVTWSEVPGMIGFLCEPAAMADEAWERLVASGEAGRRSVAAAARMLGDLDEFTIERIEAGIRGLCGELEAKPRDVFGPIRFAVTGRTVTPGLWESIHALGRDRAIERLTAVGERLLGAGSHA